MSVSIVTPRCSSAQRAIPRPTVGVVAYVDAAVGPSNPGIYAGVGVDIGPHPFVPGRDRAAPSPGACPATLNCGRSHAPLCATISGLCLPNPGGIACVSAAICAHPAIAGLSRGLEVARFVGQGPGWTNNTVAYESALTALRIIYGAGWRGPVVLPTTSQILVRQYRHECGCYVPELQSLLARLHRARSYFADLTLEWISRTDNVRADALARRAYRDALRAERRGE